MAFTAALAAAFFFLFRLRLLSLICSCATHRHTQQLHTALAERHYLLSCHIG